MHATIKYINIIHTYTNTLMSLHTIPATIIEADKKYITRAWSCVGNNVGLARGDAECFPLQGALCIILQLWKEMRKTQYTSTVHVVIAILLHYASAGLITRGDEGVYHFVEHCASSSRALQRGAETTWCRIAATIVIMIQAVTKRFILVVRRFVYLFTENKFIKIVR